MAKFQFKVYMRDGSCKYCIPSCLANTNGELLDYDKYTSDNYNLLTLSDNLGKEFGFDSSMVQTIKIFQNRGELEFSVICSNPYLTPVLEHVHHNRINGYGAYPYEGMTVDRNCQQFIEMKDYLFEQLTNNSEVFFNDIYQYQNEFNRILSQYVTLSRDIHGEAGMVVLRELEERITKGLSMYKNYRSLCKARFVYEHGPVIRNRNNNANWRTGTDIQPKNPEFDPSKFPQKPIYEVNHFVNDLGEEREEFLEEEELYSDECYGKRR